MDPVEQRLVASYAEFFRKAAKDSEGPDRQRREFIAKSFERYLSQELIDEHERDQLRRIAEGGE